MPKRVNDGPQGSKDVNLYDFNMSSTPDEKPQRATAAQLAARKIKDIRRRPRAGPATGSPAPQASFSPFNTIDPNTVSATSSATQPPISNGFSFGQSQSFPGATPPSTQSTSNGTGSFSFGGGAGGNTSSSFNFNSFGGNSAVSNPFATMPTVGSTQPPNGESFTGFKGSLFNVPPSGSQTPPQQPQATGGGLFGTQATSAGGLFGSNTATATQTAPATTGGLFGQPATSTSGAAINPFAPTTSETKPSLFGQTSTFSASGFGGINNDTMQTSPEAKPSAAAAKPSIFGNGEAAKAGFGASTTFGPTSSGGGLFGTSAANAKPSVATTQAPSQSLFGFTPAATTAPSTAPSFFSTTQPSAAAQTTAATAPTPTTTSTTTSGVFGNAGTTPSEKPQNPFQSTNLFASTSASSSQAQTAPATGTKDQSQQSIFGKTVTQGGPSTSTASLFSKAEPASTPPAAGGIFAPKSTASALEAPSTGNLFAPKPSTTSVSTAPTPEHAPSNPFAGLFVPKGETPKSVTQAEAPKAAAAPFSSLFSAKPTPAATEAKRDATNQPTSAATPPSIFTSQPSSAAPLQNGPGGPSELVVKTPGAAPVSPAVKMFEPRKSSTFPPGLTEEEKDQYDKLWRIRVLNECFKREINNLDTAIDSLDSVILFYMRIRQTIGIPVGYKYQRDGQVEKAQAPEIAKAQIPTAATPLKSQAKPAFGAAAAPVNKPSPLGQTVQSAEPAPSDLTVAPSSITSTPSKLFGSTQTSPTKKRRSEDEGAASSSPLKKRQHDDGESSTASIFAKSFSNTTAPPAQSKAPVSSQPAVSSTTPSTSPTKPTLFVPSANETSSASTSIFGSASVSKPAFSPSAGSSASNLFSAKNTGTSAPSIEIPKFGIGGGTDFLSQFKKQAEANAEKEKKRRKAEDFDSDEDDETEWERKDAEEQRKKREALEAAAKKRATFVPGKGFVFDNDPDRGVETAEKSVSAIANGAPTSATAASIFDRKSQSPVKSRNIFGHLSATPSDASGDEDEDVEDDDAEADAVDADGESNSFGPTSEADGSHDQETSEADSRVYSGPGAEISAQESSDDGEPKSTNAAQSDASSASVDGAGTPIAAPTPSGGRSLFDRIQYDDAGKPKRKGEASDQPLSSLFGNSKFSSAFNTQGTTTPNPFALSRPTSAQDSTSATNASSNNPFGSGVGSFGGIFGSPAPGASSAGASVKPGTDNTWKVNSPIKFASGSEAPTSAPKVEVAPASPAPNPSKPFSTLFGGQAQPANAKSSTQPPSLGFSFGGPSQQATSFLAPSTTASTNASRATTPGITSDTGAEESVDGDAAEPLPQVDLARGGAGEEDEDTKMELKARALKLKTGEGWQSQGLGILRILKNRNTSRARALLRADPSGNVILNTNLMKGIEYKVSGSSVQFMVPQAEGKPELWALRVKKEEVERLAAAMEEHKA